MLKLFILVGVLISLILCAVILSKLDKKSEPFSPLEATNACSVYITPDLYGDQTQFPCGNWKKQSELLGGKCNTNIGMVDCYKDQNGMYSPLTCCKAICQKDLNELQPNENCTDMSP